MLAPFGYLVISLSIALDVNGISMPFVRASFSDVGCRNAKRIIIGYLPVVMARIHLTLGCG